MGMEKKNSWIKLAAAAVLSALLLSNCVSSYNSRGQLVQSVDPAAAVIGAVAIGAIAYSAGKGNQRSHKQYRKPAKRSHYYNSPAPCSSNYYPAPGRW